jgi:HD-GYP domain-containing protein (c-di-GMP phosphodiesterase class II)
MKKLLRKLWKKISSNMILTVYVVSSLLVVGISIGSQIQAKMLIRESEHNFRDRMLESAKRLTLLTTAEELNSYREPADAAKPEWKALRQKLIKYAKDNDVTYAYYMRVIGDKIQFIVDNDLDEETRSGIDTKLEELSSYGDMLPTVEEKAKVTKVGQYAEGWEGLCSAYVLMFNADGSIAAISGVDVNDEHLLKLHSREHWLIIIKLLAFFIVFGSGYFCIKNLNRLVWFKTQEILGLQSAIVYGMATMVESRDAVTGGHVERTQHYLRTLIKGLNKVGLYKEELRKWDTKMMIEASQLHDLGKIAIPDSILNKPGSLTQQEFETMKKHVESGVSIINKMESRTHGADFLGYAKIIIETHHEKWDGSGYPKGLAGRDIPLPGRLMALADAYDTITSNRPYKEAIPPEEAARIIHEGSGSHFDPILVYAFEQVADRFAKIASQPVNGATA